ncbi:DEAD/DEAH box helicase domain-containing protein [Besnoitia besnoiti]|uniref:DEAD/DEAH box helicase domain-containing protein n=1 Tax=Besnoitia besnoiti TaxID=94643 RepID=A0A2A9MLN1_BESBE|nr:DEAD/DEAH box helicase domain-containing protein [Besnoitia besnoiti]PFH36380.1 DEAD/DEAH box helicase domain-containing protein [Besnoitia besnoiti]
MGAWSGAFFAIVALLLSGHAAAGSVAGRGGSRSLGRSFFSSSASFSVPALSSLGEKDGLLGSSVFRLPPLPPSSVTSLLSPSAHASLSSLSGSQPPLSSLHRQRFSASTRPSAHARRRSTPGCVAPFSFVLPPALASRAYGLHSSSLRCRVSRRTFLYLRRPFPKHDLTVTSLRFSRFGEKPGTHHGHLLGAVASGAPCRATGGVFAAVPSLRPHSAAWQSSARISSSPAPPSTPVQPPGSSPRLDRWSPGPFAAAPPVPATAEETPPPPPPCPLTFAGLPLPPYLSAALASRDVQVPTGIQRAALPVGASGADLLVHSETGSGKTFAYLLSLLHWHHHANAEGAAAPAASEAVSLLYTPLDAEPRGEGAEGSRHRKKPSGRALTRRKTDLSSKKAATGGREEAEEAQSAAESYLSHAACLDAPEVANAVARASACSLIVTPTRELAVQVAHEVHSLLRTNFCLTSRESEAGRASPLQRAADAYAAARRELEAAEHAASELKTAAAATSQEGGKGAPALLARAHQAQTEAARAQDRLVKARLALAHARGEGKRPRLLLVLSEPLRTAEGTAGNAQAPRVGAEADPRDSDNAGDDGDRCREEKARARGGGQGARPEGEGEASKAVSRATEPPLFETEVKQLPAWARDKIGSSLIVVGAAQTLRHLLQRLGAVQPQTLETFLKRVKHVVFDEADRLLQPLTRYAPLKKRTLRASRPRPASLLFSSLLVAKKRFFQKRRKAATRPGASLLLSAPACLLPQAAAPGASKRKKKRESSPSPLEFLHRVFRLPPGTLSPSPHPSSMDFQIIGASATVGRPLRRQLADMLNLREALRLSSSRSSCGAAEEAETSEGDQKSVSQDEREEMERVIQDLQSRGLLTLQRDTKDERGEGEWLAAKSGAPENGKGTRLMRVVRPLRESAAAASPHEQGWPLVGLPASLEHFLHPSPRGFLATLAYETSLLLHALQPRRALILLAHRHSVVSFLLHLRRLGIEHTQLLHEAFGFLSPRLTHRLQSANEKMPSLPSSPSAVASSSRLHFHFSRRQSLAQAPRESPLSASGAAAHSVAEETGSLRSPGAFSIAEERAEEDERELERGDTALRQVRDVGHAADATRPRTLLLTSMTTARGLHFDDLDYVFLVGEIENAREYQHLAGRAGRQGRRGTVVSISDAAAQKSISSWANMLGVKFQDSRQLLVRLQEGMPTSDYLRDLRNLSSSEPEEKDFATRKQHDSENDEQCRGGKDCGQVAARGEAGGLNDVQDESAHEGSEHEDRAKGQLAMEGCLEGGEMRRTAPREERERNATGVSEADTNEGGRTESGGGSDAVGHVETPLPSSPIKTSEFGKPPGSPETLLEMVSKLSFPSFSSLVSQL